MRAFRGTATRRSWALALALQAALVASGLIALRTGEADEERVEARESLVEAHEQRATVFVVSAGIVLAVVLAGFAVPRAGRIFAPAALATALAVGGLGLWTGRAGGEVVHGAGASAASAPAHDDDD